jgi:hypothetical protein
MYLLFYVLCLFILFNVNSSGYNGIKRQKITPSHLSFGLNSLLHQRVNRPKIHSLIRLKFKPESVVFILNLLLISEALVLKTTKIQYLGKAIHYYNNKS